MEGGFVYKTDVFPPPSPEGIITESCACLDPTHLDCLRLLDPVGVGCDGFWIFWRRRRSVFQPSWGPMADSGRPGTVQWPPAGVRRMLGTETWVGAIILDKHTRVGTGVHCTVLVTAHCPALNPGIIIVRSVPSAHSSNKPGLK